MQVSDLFERLPIKSLIRSALFLVIVAVNQASMVGSVVSATLNAGAPYPPATLTFDSSVLGETRRIYIQLPEGYDHSSTRYPVLVVLDGEWLYETARASVRFFSEYDEMSVALPRMIVVGIENTDRDRDYVPTKDRSDDPDFPTAGGADRFLEFLSEELLPMLDREYRTAGSRTVVGWSFSGLFAMYSAVTSPGLFDAYLCIGPAIWWDDELVVKAYRDVSYSRPKRMVITLGSYEEGGQVHTATMNFLTYNREYPIDSLTVSHLEFEGVGHSWGIPAALDRGLRELFAGFVAPDSVSRESQDAVDAYYRELSARWGFEVLPPRPVMQSLALRKWSDGDRAGAVSTLERLLSYDPDAAQAHFYRGAFLARQDLHEEALASFKDALAAEMRRTVPIGIMVSHYRDSIEKAQKKMDSSGRN